MASRKQSLPKHLPRANPKTEQEEDEDRTEITVEGRGAKLTSKIGRNGSMLLWALFWAIVVISTPIGLLLFMSFLEKLELFLEKVGILQ